MLGRIKAKLLSLWEGVSFFCLTIEMNEAENVFRRIESLEAKVAQLEGYFSDSGLPLPQDRPGLVTSRS